MEKPLSVDESNIYPEPPEELTFTHDVLTKLRDLGEDCRQRKFAHPGEVRDYIEWAPFLGKSLNGLPQVNVQFEGEDVRIPNIFSFASDEEENFKGVGALGIRNLNILESFDGTILRADALYSERRNPETMEMQFSAEIVCYVRVHDSPIIFENGASFIPRRQAVVPLNSATRMEIPEIRQLDDRRTARNDLIKRLEEDPEDINDVDSVAMALMSIEEEVTGANPAIYVELAETDLLKEASLILEGLTRKYSDRKTQDLIMQFYRTHHPLMNRFLRVECDGNFLRRELASEQEPSRPLMYPTNDTDYFVISGKLHEVNLIKLPSQQHAEIYTIFENYSSEGVAIEQLLVPIRSISRIAV